MFREKISARLHKLHGYRNAMLFGGMMMMTGNAYAIKAPAAPDIGGEATAGQTNYFKVFNQLMNLVAENGALATSSLALLISIVVTIVTGTMVVMGKADATSFFACLGLVAILLTFVYFMASELIASAV